MGREQLARRRVALDIALQALQLLVEDPVDPRRPLLHAAADVAADDIALREARAAFGRFQAPAERPVDALHLQRAERTAQTQSCAWRGVNDLQMLNRATASSRSQKQPPARSSMLRLAASREKV